MLDDNNHFLKRLKRHTENTTALGGLAVRFLLNQDNFADSLTQTLGGLKGPVMKVAQILSTIPDMLPENYGETLASLQSKAPPMGWLFVKRRLRTELGEDWETHFASFEKEASFAASLGQVHKATSLEGETLAVKVQYPDMSSTVEADLQQLKLLLKLYETSQGSLQTQDVMEEITSHLREELDYENEAHFMGVFGRIFEDIPVIHIPQTIPTLSTQKLLTMTWLEGEKLQTFEDANQDLRNTLAKNLFRAWYEPLYHYGVLHGDPHLGNYTATPEGQLNLFDFGCVRVFDPSFIEGILVLYQALQAHDMKKTAEAYEIWGFKNLSNDLIETLNLWATYLYDPILDNTTRFIHKDLNTQEGQKIATTIHRKLKELGGIAPPREFVFMDRAAVGLGSAFLRLKAHLNWHDLFQELVEDFNKESVLMRQKNVLS
jgi:predicted unusual protein kinase regulating ubiquinone biosynthesis (AarF/ABC1/UbiB family)